jgi:hypothetical protein
VCCDQLSKLDANFSFISQTLTNFLICMGFAAVCADGGKNCRGRVANACQIAAHTFY